MSKPLIGIVPSKGPDPTSDEREAYFIGKPYIDSIIGAGGVPLVLPHGVDVETVISLIDGWMIIGGHDIDPKLYGQETHKDTRLEPPGRFDLESALYEVASRDLPILGICYGCQFLNVKRGGDLIQHLPDLVGHKSHEGGTREPIRLEPGSQIGSATRQETIDGKSYHHQAVHHVGQGLVVSAWASDGTVEAIEDPDANFMVAVQWHPERTPDDPASVQIFKTFIEKAKEYREAKSSCGTW
jgi:putative glutamine amidotransferase